MNLLHPVIEVKDVKKTFQQLPVLKGVDLEVLKGDLTVLIGASGCGKSTLLRCLNGLEKLDSGKIRIGAITLEGNSSFEQNALKMRTRVGMVFQSFNLFPHLTVLENTILAPMTVKKVSREQATEIAIRLLDKVGLKTHLNHYPIHLSGGQQQRAAIARALAMEPEVMLYDEPTSALDPTLVGEVLAVMKTLNQEGMTTVVVTHEMRFAREAADKIVFVEAGKIIETASPDEMFSNPKQESTRQYLRHFL